MAPTELLALHRFALAVPKGRSRAAGHCQTEADIGIKQSVR